MGEINHDENDEWKEIVFPAFYRHMRRTSYGNGDKRISTIAFKVRRHPDNSTILKSILSRISSDDNIPLSEETIHFVPYGLIQHSSPECYHHQIIMHNTFLHKLAIIIIFNIDSEIMYSELLPSLQEYPKFKGIAPTHSTDSNGKWSIITTNASKEAAIVIIDSLIEKNSAPNSNPNKLLGRSTKYNINLVSYAAMLQKIIEPTYNTKKNPPIGVQKRNFQISYDLTSFTDFPSLTKNSKPSPPN